MLAGALEIQIFAQLARLQSDMNQAKGMVNNAMAGIERAAASAKMALGSIGIGAGLAQLIPLVDQYTKFTAQLKLATTSATEYSRALSDVKAISKEAQSDLGVTGNLYAKITNATKEMGASQKTVADITKVVSLGLKVSGATAQESSSAMLQLSQAFNSGVLRGQEFNSVNEASPRIMKALADGIGVPVGALRGMAEAGKLTTEVMANALPRALEELKKEAASVQTISGAFQVLKNSVMEFVGVSAQSSGSVSVLTTAITSLANNLNLVMSLLAGIAAAKAASFFLGVATAVQQKTAALVVSAQAVNAERVASIAASQADIARIQSTIAFVTADRAKTVSELQSAQATIAATSAIGVHSAALRYGTIAAAAHAVAITKLADLGRLQAISTAQLATAQAALAKAQTAVTGATTLASRALAFLGGPIGLITTALGLGVTAWMAWGDSADDANKLAAESTAASTAEILSNLDKQNERLRDRIGLLKAGSVEAAKAGGEPAERMARILKAIEKERQNEFSSLPSNKVDKAYLADLQDQYDKINKALLENKELQSQISDIGKQSKAAEWAEKYSTKAEKLAAELKKAREELGKFFTPELESRIRDKFKEKEIKEKITDYQKLTQEIAKLSAEEQKRIALGRELTDGEKRQIDLMSGLASGALKMTEKEIPLAKALLDTFAAQQKVRIESEKLKKAREEIAGIATSAETANAEYLERLEFENSLIGKSALQVAQLTAAYQSNLTLKRQFADIDKATKGLTDPAAIAKLKAESNARIEAIKAESRAKIEAKYIADVQQTIKVRSDPAITQEMGARLMPEEVARRTAAAKAEHDAALAKIADLDVIQGRLKIEEELKSKINKAELEAHDIELARATGASIMADEAAEKIAKYGADNVAYAEAALAISRDTGLQEYRGFEERNKQLQARVEFFTAEAEAKKSALGVSANQLEFDKANILLQQQLYQIQLDAGDLDEQKKLGLAHQIKMQDELIGFLARKRNLDMSQVGSGEELVEINKELLRLKKAIDGLDVGAEAKAKAQADAAKTQLEAAQKLADTAKKTMNANMVQQFESDFHNGMLRLLEQGNTSWGAMMKGWKNSFKVNVVDYIYKQLAKPYIFKFIASFAGLVGANGVASAANTAADAALAGTSSTSWMSILKNGYDALSGGFKAFGDLVSTGLSKAGVSATNAGMAGTAASYLGAGMAGVTIGTFIAGDKTLLGMNGMTTSVLGAALSAALLPGLGPIGLFIGGIAGGALNAFFGMGPKQYGQTTVKGGFSGEGFAGKMVTPWTQKGGVFRKGRSGEDPSPLGEPAQQFLNSLVGKSGASFARLITLSGDAARSVDGWSFAINRALTTEEDMTKLFGDMADSMGTFVIPELEKFRAKGENLADTAVRMGDEYVITESIFRMMGFTAAETGIASLGMRDSLIQLMGGIQQTSATMDSYYKNFYTADEQQANSLRQVNDAFKVLGLVAPTTRAEFRALAETLVQDTTPAGQGLFASLMALNPAFAAVTQSTEELAAASLDAMNSIGAALDRLRGNGSASLLQAQLAQDTAMAALTAAAPWIESMDQLKTITMEDAGNYSTANKLLIAGALGAAATLQDLQDRIRAGALADAQKSVTDAFSAVQKTVQSERELITKAYQSSLDKVNKSVTTVTASIDKLKSLSNALKQSVADIMPPSRAQAQAQIMTALAIAKAGGGLPSAESLSGALQSISEPSQKLFSTFVEWQTDQKITANNIAALAGMSDEQITVQDRQLSVLEATRQVLEGTQAATMERLDGILTRGQLQLDEMNGIDASIVSVDAAVNMMSDALNNFIRVRNNEPGFVGNESTGTGTGPGGTYTFEDQYRDRYGAGSTASAGKGADGVQSIAGGGGSAAFNKAWSLLNHVPYDARQNQDALEEYLRLLTRNKPTQYHIPPGFANGGYHAGGMRVVGENGPELEFTGPSRIRSNSDSKKLLNNDEVVAVVRELIETVKAGDIAIAKSTAETAKYAKRWDGNGILVRAEESAPLNTTVIA